MKTERIKKYRTGMAGIAVAAGLLLPLDLVGGIWSTEAPFVGAAAASIVGEISAEASRISLELNAIRVGPIVAIERLSAMKLKNTAIINKLSQISARSREEIVFNLNKQARLESASIDALLSIADIEDDEREMKELFRKAVK